MSFSWGFGAIVIKIHGKAGQQSNNVTQGSDWRSLKGMQRFMAAFSTGAAWNIGNIFAVEKTVRDVGEEGVCVCGKVRLQKNFLGKERSKAECRTCVIWSTCGHLKKLTITILIHHLLS